MSVTCSLFNGVPKLKFGIDTTSFDFSVPHFSVKIANMLFDEKHDDDAKQDQNNRRQHPNPRWQI